MSFIYLGRLKRWGSWGLASDASLVVPLETRGEDPAFDAERNYPVRFLKAHPCVNNNYEELLHVTCSIVILRLFKP